MLPCKFELLQFFFFYSPLLLSDFDSPSAPPPPPHPLPVTGAGLFCWGLAEAADGKSAGEAANTSCLPEFERVNLHRGHNCFSLAKAPHMQPACHQPCSCSLTPFCVSLVLSWTSQFNRRSTSDCEHCITSTVSLEKKMKLFICVWRWGRFFSYKCK